MKNRALVVSHIEQLDTLIHSLKRILSEEEELGTDYPFYELLASAKEELGAAESALISAQMDLVEFLDPRGQAAK